MKRISEPDEKEQMKKENMRMNKTELYDRLKSLQDLKYREMQIKIIPTVEPAKTRKSLN